MDLTDYLPKDLFAGRAVFVTGGGSGINLGIARGFASLGAGVGICGRTAEKLERARGELEALGAEVSTSVADVRDPEAVAAALATAKDELGPLSVLVCGAAGNFPAPAEALSPNGFRAVVDIDLVGSFNACHAAFEQLRETRGVVIFISAGQAFRPYALQAHVGAAKAGVDNLMENLALEWGRHGIRSVSIAPGPIAGTEGMERLVPDELRGPLAEAIPLGRLGETGDIAATAVFLASPLASWITGTRVVVDGGQNLPGSGVLTRMLMRAAAGERKG